MCFKFFAMEEEEILDATFLRSQMVSRKILQTVCQEQKKSCFIASNRAVAVILVIRNEALRKTSGMSMQR